MVADAVLRNRSPLARFPANREKNREKRVLSQFRSKQVKKGWLDQQLTYAIPYATEQGI